MSSFARARAALPVTFAVYALEAGVAASAALPLFVELADHLVVARWDGSAQAALLDAGPQLATALRGAGLEALLAFGALWLLGPWLHMSWLAALAGLAPWHALERGRQVALRAVAVSLWVAAIFVLLTLPFGLLAYALHRWLSGPLQAPSHDLALLAALSPLAPIALFTHALHDLARAQALELRARVSVRRALRLVLRPTVQARALGWLVLGHALVLAASATASALPQSVLGLAATTATLQSALLARLVIRSVWLATATALTSAETSDAAAAISPLGAHDG